MIKAFEKLNIKKAFNFNVLYIKNIFKSTIFNKIVYIRHYWSFICVLINVFGRYLSEAIFFSPSSKGFFCTFHDI